MNPNYDPSYRTSPADFDEMGCQRCGEDYTKLVSVQAPMIATFVMHAGDEIPHPDWLRHDYDGAIVCGVLVCTACGQVQGDAFPANPY